MSRDPEKPAAVREIRRYPNRRYYDTSSSRHVTLEGIREVIREGGEVRVTEAASGEDISSRVLTQILLDYDTPKIAVLPPAMLHRLIRSSEPLLVEFMERYFADAMGMFEDAQRSLRDQWSRLAGLAGGPRTMADWWQAGWGAAVPPRPEAEAAVAPDVPPPESGAEALRKEVGELRAQLAAMRRELARLKPDRG